jgi:hypothetical protein
MFAMETQAALMSPHGQTLHDIAIDSQLIAKGVKRKAIDPTSPRESPAGRKTRACKLL